MRLREKSANVGRYARTAVEHYAKNMRRSENGTRFLECVHPVARDLIRRDECESSFPIALDQGYPIGGVSIEPLRPSGFSRSHGKRQQGETHGVRGSGGALVGYQARGDGH